MFFEPRTASRINAIINTGAHNDTYYTNILHEVGGGSNAPHLPNVLGDVVDHSSIEQVVSVPLPPVPALVQSLWYLAPISWVSQTDDPDNTLTVSLHGFSHGSGNRRCYSRCPWHRDCFKYCFLSSFPEPWQTVVYVLKCQHLGVVCPTKKAHKEVTISNGDDLRAEMPEQAFDMRLKTG